MEKDNVTDLAKYNQDKIFEELRAEALAMAEEPWDYTHLKDCRCGSDDLEISEFDHPEGGFFCAYVQCNNCGNRTEFTRDEAADEIWNKRI